MDNFTTMFAPILFGLLLITAVNRAIVFWQEERSPQIFYIAMTYSCFCLLYLASSLEWPAPWRDAIRAILLWALAWGNWYEWRELIVFLRKKELRPAQPPDPEPVPPGGEPKVVTLGNLSKMDNAVAIEASEPVEPPPSEPTKV